METIIVRLDLEPEAAALLDALVEKYHSERVGKLANIVPIHTRAVLEKQRELAESLDRTIKRAIQNPEVVEIPDPAGS